jgi:thioesterase domain-containing protein
MHDDVPPLLCEIPELSGAGENVAERPAQAEQESRRPSIAEDMQNLRVFRSNARRSDGTLDLLVPMRTGGNGPPLFCVHPMVGLSWCYIALLPHVDARYPLYGLQSRGLRRPEPLPVNMEEVARDFADRIRTAQPAGPYHLLGWSLGGNIAFAVAEELERRGEQIGLLAIMDSLLVNFDAIENTSQPWMIYNLVLAQFGYVPALTPAEQDPEARMMEIVRRRPGLGLDKWPDERLRALQRVIRNNVRVSRGMRPGRVHCPLLFFAAGRNDLGLDELLENWRQYLDGPIQAIELDCAHQYMLLPQIVSQIGPELSDAMARC